MDTTDLERRILDFVTRPRYQPVKPRVIAERLNLSKEESREAKRAVKRLVRRGQLAYGANHLVKPAEPDSPKSGRVVGTFQRMQAGFGFVRLHDPATGAPFVRSQQAEPPEDVYIPAKWTADAASGDVVLAQLNRQRPGDPGPRGEIIEVMERQTQQFVGTYFEEAEGAYVWVDGRVFAQPIAVGDPGAKNAQPDDKVVFEMIRFPSPAREGEGVITEVLGPRGKPGVDTLSILREFCLPDEFPDDVLDEAREQARQFDETDLAGRL
ncbi:MAG: ribonuclease R, partial [Thermoguttaceae bacterium]